MPNVQYTPAVYPQANTADGGYKVAQGFREGSMSFVDFTNKMAAAGRVFNANFGTVATQLTFLAQAANRPDFWIRVPSSTTIIPVACNIALGAMAGTVTTIDMRIASNDIGNGTSSAASIGPLNMRTDQPLAGGGAAGNCTARQLATADTTAETSPQTIWKNVAIRADDAGGPQQDWHTTRDQMGYPFLVGAGTWECFIWATTTQATGYATMTWIETPSTWWT